MLDAQLLRLSGWMQRISEHDDPGETFELSGTEMRRHPATHRLAADEQSRRVAPLPRARRRRPRNAFSSTGALSGILRRSRMYGKVEGHDVDTASRKALRHGSHERVLLACARAVREHEQRIWLAVCSISNRTERRQVHANQRYSL